MEELADKAVYVDVMPKDFRFDAEGTAAEQHEEGYEQELRLSQTEAALQLSKVPADGEVWKSKLLIRTGTTPEPGARYRVSTELTASRTMDFEICYNRDDEEKGLGAVYGLTAYPETRSFEYTAYAGRDTHLILQVSLGKCSAPNAFTVSNIRVEKVGETEQVSRQEYWFLQLAASVWNGERDGALRIAEDTIELYMTVISPKEGDNKLSVSGLPLNPERGCTISFRARADKPLTGVFALNRSGAWDTLIYEELALTEQWQEFRFEVPAGTAQDASYELLWQFGSDANVALGGAVAEIAELTVEPD